MKSILITIIAVALTTSAMASDFGFGKKTNPNSLSPMHSTGSYVVDEGNMIFSLGYGSPNIALTIMRGFAPAGVQSKGAGPLHFKFEYMLSDRFGAGIVVNQVSSSASWTSDSLGGPYNYEASYNSIAFNIRFNWHYFNTNKVDLYAGGGVGYKKNNWSFGGNDQAWIDRQSITQILPLGLEFTAGVRYFFTDFIGAYVEVGVAKSIIQGGIAIKL